MNTTFADFGLPPRLVTTLADLGITEPFPIQAQTLPDLIEGRDLCGRAPTGSGKTLAFGLPLVAGLRPARPGRPTALILAPTRELAGQIHDDLRPLIRSAGRHSVAVFGGVDIRKHIKALDSGADLIVATPGRLRDLIDRGDCSLEEIEIVVIDEADRMADMGFLPEVKKLLNETPNDRQTVLFSATLDGDVAAITKQFQRDPVRHEYGEVEPDISAMTHFFWKVEPTERVEITADAITAIGPTIVFCRTRHGVDRVARQLRNAGVRTAWIHGGRNQSQRDRALAAFTSGECAALVATDVAARGIHVDGVAGVIHFDPPEDDKTYLHRSGRTARAGASGVVVSMVVGKVAKQVKGLQKDLGLPTETSGPDLAGLRRAAPEYTPMRPKGSARDRYAAQADDSRDRRANNRKQSDGPRAERRPERPQRDDKPRYGKPGHGQSRGPKRDDERDGAGRGGRNRGPRTGESDRKQSGESSGAPKGGRNRGPRTGENDRPGGGSQQPSSRKPHRKGGADESGSSRKPSRRRGPKPAPAKGGAAPTKRPSKPSRRQRAQKRTR